MSELQTVVSEATDTKQGSIKEALRPAQVGFEDSEKRVVFVRVRPDATLGVEVNHNDGASLLIENVNPGLVDSWNMVHPEQMVSVGDRIVAVNGHRGDVAEIVRECLEAAVLEVAIRPRSAVVPLSKRSARRAELFL